MRQFTILTAALTAIALSGAAGASPVGLWRAKDGAQIRIASCGRTLCGFVATTNPRLDPQTGRPPVDKHNPDPARRNRPLVGLQILFGMTPSAPAVWAGELYNEDDGRTYRGKIREMGPRAIRIEGCAGVLCGGENLTRLR